MRLGGCVLPQRYILVVAEKPRAAAKIAEALSEGYTRRCLRGRVPFWVTVWRGYYYVIAPAAGHLFGLTTSEQGVPVFSYYWAPLWEIDDNAKHTQQFFEVIRLLSSRAWLFVNACDYDVEGSVIGYNILRGLKALNRARRAKYSALTKADIRRAFSRLEPLDWDMIEAGLARHELDWIWGINISRALMEALKRVSGKRVVLSAGRVQSPTLLEAVKRSMARRLHVPLPYFEVLVTVNVKGTTLRLVVARQEKLEEARRVAEQVKRAGYVVVEDYSERVVDVPPPYPFNLGDLQAEASRIYGFSPYYTQKIAEELYLEGLISYPRTNSQQIPSTIDVKSILRGLELNPTYKRLIGYLYRKTRGILNVNNGPKTDPAHPAIHPTGEQPSRKLGGNTLKLYDLIVRRFLASMMPPAKIVKISIIIGVPPTARAIMQGVNILDPSWFEIYYWSKPATTRLPKVKQGETFPIKSVRISVRYESPPKPHTKTSLVKWMESVGIGTEATRARIVELLFERRYLELVGSYVYPTRLGETVAEILAVYFPKIVDVMLTREFEEKLEAIRSGRLKRSQVIGEAKKLLSILVEEFLSRHAREAGLELAYSLGYFEPTRKCPICGSKAEEFFCRNHALALKALTSGYKEWRRRLGDISCTEFLERISRLKSTGNLVRDVALYLLRNRGVLASYLECRE